MIEEEEGLVVPAGAPDERELLLYDYFKHLTSLSLLTLGGILIVLKDLDLKDVRPAMIIFDIVLVSLGGIFAFSGSGEIVRARFQQEQRYKVLNFYRAGAPALLAVGVGVFLSIFLDSLT